MNTNSKIIRTDYLKQAQIVLLHWKDEMLKVGAYPERTAE